MTNNLLDLHRRDADVAIRPIDKSDSNRARVAELHRGLNTGLWLLAHPDLVRSARVHAFVDHFIAALGSPDNVSLQSRTGS